MARGAISLLLSSLVLSVLNAAIGEETGRALLAAQLTTRSKLCGVRLAKAGSNVLKFRTNVATPLQLMNMAGNMCFKQIGAGYTSVVPAKCPQPPVGKVLKPAPDTWVIPEEHPKYPGWYWLRVFGKAKCWDVVNGKLALFDCTKNTRQLWQPRLSPDGYIQLVYRATNGCLQRYAGTAARFWPAPCSKAPRFWSQAVDVLRCKLS